LAWPPPCSARPHARDCRPQQTLMSRWTLGQGFAQQYPNRMNQVSANEIVRRASDRGRFLLRQIGACHFFFIKFSAPEPADYSATELCRILVPDMQDVCAQKYYGADTNSKLFGATDGTCATVQ